jgi:5-methylcytosine-specific restriction protein B
MPRLTPERLRELYDLYLAANPWPDWATDFLADLTWATSATDDELRTADAQRRLWTLRGLGTTGPAERLFIEPLPTDPAFIDLLLEVRNRGWDTAANRRGPQLQAAYNKLIEHVSQAVPGNTPRSRLVRIFHALQPGDVHCVYNAEAAASVRDLVLGSARGQGRIEVTVLVRDRLREVLGREQTLQDHVHRSMFCWWLHEHAATLREGGTPGVTAPEPTPPVVETTSPPPLVLLPLHRQIPWLVQYKGGLEAIRATLREALEPRTTHELFIALREELDLSAESWVIRLANDLRRLDLLRPEGERLVTTEAGAELLEGGPPDVLIEALITRFAAFAMVLRALHEQPRTSAELGEIVKAFTLSGKVVTYVLRRLWWGRATGLLEPSDGRRYKLTSQGEAWHSRLPESLEQPDTAKVDLDLFDDDQAIIELPVAHPTLPELRKLFTDHHPHFVLDPADLRALHTAWTFHDAKRFVLLSGLSGTGKTQLLVRYAELVCAHMGLDPRHHLAKVPVRPDWRDPTGLLGYFNALHAEPTFQAEPALRLVIRAARDPHRPYFLVLDEMNLARVERYFAPFLSAMETPGIPLELHAHDEIVNDVPSSIPWPRNLRIGGTVNMDETTHPFSDKVLDRAFTLEFWEINLDAFMAQRPSLPAPAVVEALRSVQAHLRPVRRHVGYRTLGEVLDWVEAARGHDPSATLDELLDAALFAKVLPRLRGAESPALTEAIRSLTTVANGRWPRCHDKLIAMQQRLTATGVTGFWS